VAVKNAKGTMKFNPSPDTIIHGGDCLIVIGGDEQLKRLETLASTFSA
jgi:K+/H+ antiporter YhaU regulatory subunit KhtT